MTNLTRTRRTELSALGWVFLLIGCGLALVCFGKLSTHAALPGSVNINTADSRTLAAALGVAPQIGKALAVEREAMRGHQFGSVHDMRHARALAQQTIVYDPNQLVARTATQVAQSVFLGLLAYLAAFLIVHLVLRRAAPDADPFILPLVAFLSGIGLIAVFTVQDPLRDSFVFASQASGVALFGAIAFLTPLSRPFGRLILRRYQYAYAAAGIALVVLLILFGKGPGGVHLTLLGFEPVEVVKLLLVLFVVSYLAERRGLMSGGAAMLPRRQDFAPLVAIYVVALALFKVMNDLGPAVLLFGAFVTLLYLSTGRRRHPIVGLLLLVIAGAVGNAMHLGFFATRVTMWLHPWDNHDPRGGQLAQGLWGMATGGIFGSGLGLGEPGYMSRAGSDLVFATIGEELGVFGTLALLLAYSVLVARGYRIALKAGTEFDRLLAAGLTSLLAIQTMMIVGGVTGLVPLTGMTLPFISFGSSSLVVDFFMVGLLLQIAQKNAMATVVDPAPPHWPRAIRLLSLGASAYFLVGIGLLRLLPIQVLKSDSFATQALTIPDRDGVMRPHVNPRLLAYAAAIPRGRIEDRNGVVLARDADIDPPQSPHKQGEAAPSMLAGRGGVGFGIGYFTPDGRKRIYSGGPCMAHLMYAVEGQRRADNPLGMDAVLRGYDSYSLLLSSYRCRYLPGWQPPRGQDVHLSIDLNLQRTAFTALERVAHGIRDQRTGQPLDRGAAVVVAVNTGEVLAAVTSPSFDPMTLTDQSWSELTANTDRRSVLLDRASKGLYPPGSTFKIVTATAGLEHGLGATIVDCRHTATNVVWRSFGTIYSRRRITDDEGFVPHGITDMSKAIRVSCNIYFATLAIKMGADALHDTAVSDFGLRHLASAEKIGEDLPDCGYGQGTILVTPVEMATVAQAVANDGWQIPAQYLRQSPSDSASGSNPGHRALSAANADSLQTMMLSVTTVGTAQGVFDGLPVAVAGKTGSAQNNQGDGRTHSWFIGFAPANHPSIAFACVVENGGFGRAAAAPVCREIVRAAL